MIYELDRNSAFNLKMISFLAIKDEILFGK
jgi:hypothetical protein